MGLVALENLSEGAVLSEDVRDINGRLMLSKGQQISSSHIRILKMWGIPEISIQGNVPEEQGPAVAKDAQRLRQAEQTVQVVLQYADPHHPAMEVISRAAIERRYQTHHFFEMSAPQVLPDSFKLDLANGVKTQIHFSDLQLPETPEIITDFNTAIEDPLTSAADLAEIVNRSPSLSALVLKMANSAFFGLVSEVETISRAITVIGCKEISSLVMGIGMMRLFYSIPKEIIDMSSFLRHSLACGIFARVLAAQKNLLHTERLFVAGLLHDIGRLVLYRYFPEQTKLLLAMAKKTGLSVYEMEKECLGIGHMQIAGHLLRKWKLPTPLEDIIVHHHTPSRSSQPVETGIVHLADIAVNALGLGHSGEYIVPRFEWKCWDQLGISPGTVRLAIQQTLEQITVMESIFAELQQ